MGGMFEDAYSESERLYYGPRSYCASTVSKPDQDTADTEKTIEGMKDTGARSEFNTGSVREPVNGRGRPELISPYALRQLAIWCEKGAEKYSDRNWEKGQTYSRCTGSLLRHMIAWMAGENDEDHLTAIMWNAMALIHFRETDRQELDDMPHYDQMLKEEAHRIEELIKAAKNVE